MNACIDVTLLAANLASWTKALTALAPLFT